MVIRFSFDCKMALVITSTYISKRIRKIVVAFLILIACIVKLSL